MSAMSDHPLTPSELANRARENAKNLRSGGRRFGAIHTIVIEPEPFARLYEELADEVDRLTGERNRAWSVRDRLDKQFSEQLAKERAGREQAEQERDDLFAIIVGLGTAYPESLFPPLSKVEMESVVAQMNADDRGVGIADTSARFYSHVARERAAVALQDAREVLGRGNQG